MSVALSLESCVRTLSIKSECAKCKDACEFDAISFDNYSVRIDAIKCKDCAACVALCPSSAITMHTGGLDSLSADELFCVGVKSLGGIVVNAPKEFVGACSDRVNEANSLLEAFGVKAKIALNIINEEKQELEDSSRRTLFKMFTKEGVKAAHESVQDEEERAFTIDYALLKSKKIPAKREFFLGAIDGLELAQEEVSLAISFASDKYIDDTCDNCSLCYNLCPGGALETTSMKNAILFSPHLCIKCKLCEDVCESKSISSMPTFPLSAFKNRQKKLLKKFAAKLCVSCGAVFSADSDECPRCAMESEDARELLGL